jgi:predicted protein tyrosine phosphatase
MENLKLLFVCGKNLLRSPTAESIFCEYSGLEVDSAGVDSFACTGGDRDAETPLGIEAIQWADIIFVMEKTHLRKLRTKFQPELRNKRIICLDIPDNYEYMQPELVALLDKKVLPLLGTFGTTDY